MLKKILHESKSILSETWNMTLHEYRMLCADFPYLWDEFKQAIISVLSFVLIILFVIPPIPFIGMFVGSIASRIIKYTKK
jgi:hypothetical protein